MNFRTTLTVCKSLRNKIKAINPAPTRKENIPRLATISSTQRKIFLAFGK